MAPKFLVSVYVLGRPIEDAYLEVMAGRTYRVPLPEDGARVAVEYHQAAARMSADLDERRLAFADWLDANHQALAAHLPAEYAPHLGAKIKRLY